MLAFKLWELFRTVTASAEVNGSTLEKLLKATSGRLYIDGKKLGVPTSFNGGETSIYPGFIEQLAATRRLQIMQILGGL
jgi:hypothetical protein